MSESKHWFLDPVMGVEWAFEDQPEGSLELSDDERFALDMAALNAQTIALAPE